MSIHRPSLDLESFDIVEIDKKPWRVMGRHSDDEFFMRDMKNGEEKVVHIDTISEKVGKADRVVLR